MTVVSDGGTAWGQGKKQPRRGRGSSNETHSKNQQSPTPFPSLFPSSSTAAALENRARFVEAVHFNVPLPAPHAALANALAGVSSLTIDERASPVGGFTDALARALARGGGAAKLHSLALTFVPWSDAADLFTDRGLAALAAGAGASLTAVSLTGATAVTDRGLAALGAHARRLSRFEFAGYSELISDAGLAALAVGGCLTAVSLGRLPRVTDAGVAALAAAAPRLEAVVLPPGATDAALAALAEGPAAERGVLRVVDASAARRGVTGEGVARLAGAGVEVCV